MKYLVKCSIILAAFSTIATAHAANGKAAIMNGSVYQYLLTGKTGAAANCEGACYPVLSFNAQQWVFVSAPASGWIDLEYDVCENISYASGAAQCENYLGHFGITFSGNIAGKISNADQGTVDVSINSQTSPIYTLKFSPKNPPVADVIPPARQYAKAPFRGVNISAPEFNSDSGNIDWIINDGFANKTDLAYFAKSGMNTYRMPIRWSYAQPQLSGPLNTQYVDKLYQSTKLYLDSGYNVMIDLHSYMHFEADPRKDPLTSSLIVSDEQLVDFWNKLSDRFKDLAKAYPNALSFDLMNEPTDDISSDAVVKKYNAVLAMLRQKGINNLVLLEGAHYSGMHSWFTSRDNLNRTNADAFSPENINDPAKNYAINVHQYFDDNFSGTKLQCTGYPMSEIKKFIDWSKQTKQRFMVTEFGGPDAGNCQPIIVDFLNTVHTAAVEMNSTEGGFLGWTAWAGGRFWGGYPLSVYKEGGAQGLPGVLVNWGLLQED